MGKTLHNITIFIKETGKKVLIKELDSSLTPQEIIEKYADNLKARGSLLRKLTRFEIEDYNPIETAEIQNGETLVLLPALLGGGGIPIRDYKDIHLIKYIIEKSKAQESQHETTYDFPELFALILYTEEDKSLSTYIKEHVNEISEMSHISANDEVYRNTVLFFVIEKPSTEWRIEIEKDLGALAGIHFDSIWERLEGNIYAPYDKSKAYDIAKSFGVTPKQLPCVLFFTNLGSYQTLVVQISEFTNSTNEEEFTKFFRMLFTNAQEAVLSGPNTVLKKLSYLMQVEKRKHIMKSTDPIQLVELAKSIMEIIGNILMITKNP